MAWFLPRNEISLLDETATERHQEHSHHFNHNLILQLMKAEKFADLIQNYVSAYNEVYPLGKCRTEESFKNRAAMFSAMNISLDMTAHVISKHTKRDRSSIHRAIQLHKDNMIYMKGYREAFNVATKMIAHKIHMVAMVEDTKRLLDEVTEIKDQINDNLKDIEQSWNSLRTS